MNIKPTGAKTTTALERIRDAVYIKKYAPKKQSAKNKTCHNCNNVYLDCDSKCPKCGK